jgi:RND superfamily putative drug exporter
LAFSGVDTLIQIGIGALVGLLLYATLFMGLIMPACVIAMSRADSALSLRIKETLRKLRRS